MIATLARQAVEQGLKVVVVSGDKDLLQLVSDDVLVISPGREGAPSILYDRKTVEEKLGVPPERVVDVLALVGDSVDNVPGVPGIGEKGARDLVKEFGALEDVLANADKIKRNAYREGLINNSDAAILSKSLVTLRADVPVTLDLEALKRRPPDRSGRERALHGAGVRRPGQGVRAGGGAEPHRVRRPRRARRRQRRGRRRRARRRRSRSASCATRASRCARSPSGSPWPGGAGTPSTSRSTIRRWRSGRAADGGAPGS